MRLLQFTEVFEDRTRSFAKIPKAEYLSTGAFPIIDQSKGEIAGFTDAADLISDLGQVIIFGDHTRAVKFRSGAFALGADGTKALVPKIDVSAKYLYYWLRAQNVPSLGYSRHFKLLKKLEVPIPSMKEQLNIVRVLDLLDTLCQKSIEAIEHLDELRYSVFQQTIEPFCDQIMPIGKIASVGTGGTPKRTNPENFGGSIPWVKTSEVQMGVISETEESITQLGVDSSSCKVYPIGSIVIAMYGQGQTRGRSAILGIPAATNQACAVIQTYSGIDKQFLFQQLQGSYEKLRQMARGGNQENLNLAMVKAFQVVVPPLPVQQELVKRITIIEQLKEKIKARLLGFEMLISSFESRSFEINV